MENTTITSAGDRTPKHGSNLTIMVVDDNKEILDFLVLLLSKHGLSVMGVSSGGECLDLVKSRPVDLILLDVMMPVMNGFQVCQELKHIGPSIPIILLTARDDMNTRAAAMDLGVSEFVAKPVNNQDLLNRIQMQLHMLDWDKTAEQAFLKMDGSTTHTELKK